MKVEAQEVHLWRGNPNGGAVDDESEALVDGDRWGRGDNDLRGATPSLVIVIRIMVIIANLITIILTISLPVAVE